MAFKILRQQRKYTEKQLRDMCILALLHDIGAYKTEEIDLMLSFETKDIWRHAVYGYQFLYNFSPLRQLAPALFLHHADCRDLHFASSSYHDLAQIICICDRADILTQLIGRDTAALRTNLQENRGKQFLPHIVDAFYDAGLDGKLSVDNINKDSEFYQALYGTPLTDQETYDYLKMIALSIDFRSQQTAIHTLAVKQIAAQLAGLANLSGAETEKITTGALLHDIGKTGIPMSIVEKPGRLSEDEMSIMRTHIQKAADIINCNVDEEIAQIAVRHHEKLDGCGYPYSLNAAELNVNERILAVADIFSALVTARSYKEAYSKEKTTSILRYMAASGAIDADIVALAVNNFDDILAGMQAESQPLLNMYEQIRDDYIGLMEQIQLQKGKNSRKLLLEQDCPYL